MTTGVLFTSAEAKKVPPRSSVIERLGVRSARRVAILASASMTPVRTSAAERTNIAPIVTGAGLPNTA